MLWKVVYIAVVIEIAFSFCQGNRCLLLICFENSHQYHLLKCIFALITFYAVSFVNKKKSFGVTVQADIQIAGLHEDSSVCLIMSKLR